MCIDYARAVVNKDTKKDKFCCYSEKLLGKLLGELSGKRRTTVLIKKKIY